MKDKIKLSIFWVTSFIIIIFIMCFRVHAEEPYFPMHQNDNDLVPDYAIEYVESTIDPNDNLIVIGGIEIISDYFIFHVASMPKVDGSYIYGEIYNNGYQWSLYSIGSEPISYFEYKLDTSWGVWYISDETNSYWVGNNSSIYSEYVSYVSNFKIYTNNDPSNRSIVLNYSDGPSIIDIGAAIIPPDAIVPDYPSGITAPSQVPPTYTASDYNWTTPPTFDSSSIENAIGSIQNTLGWIANNLKEEFKNLTNNLKGFFKYIGDTIQYYGNALLSTLNNFIQNFYDNMKSLVEPIFQKIDYITTPLEADVIWDNISGTSLITNYSSIMNAASSMKSSFENLSEPTDYKIPIHLEDLPSSWFGNLTTQYIDLGVINPVKSILRTFMWALITYSLFVTIIDSIANYINGGGDES